MRTLELSCVLEVVNVPLTLRLVDELVLDVEIVGVAGKGTSRSEVAVVEAAVVEGRAPAGAAFLAVVSLVSVFLPRFLVLRLRMTSLLSESGRIVP